MKDLRDLKDLTMDDERPLGDEEETRDALLDRQVSVPERHAIRQRRYGN